jgi:hypothetical protein
MQEHPLPVQDHAAYTAADHDTYRRLMKATGWQLVARCRD